MAEKPHLVSFKICPFVQRSVIALLEKKQDFDITYIDLDNKPQWFLDISPTGKVPVLQVQGEAIFESSVINEYLDEVYSPAIHPADPLQKAKNRAFIEFLSGLFMTFFQAGMAADKAAFESKKQELFSALEKLNNVIKGPFFNGETFALIDCAAAPLFMRLDMLEKEMPGNFYPASADKLKAYAKELSNRKSIQKSVVDDFSVLFKGFLRKKGAYIAQFLSE